MSKQAVLLVNLGSPDSPTKEDLLPYLDEFLMDKYVIDYPYILRAALVRGIILNTRPKKSAAAYQKIWWENGSPLIVISRRVQQALQQRLSIPVGLGMRYGKPTIEQGIKQILNEHPDLDNLFVIPLYPQYAESTTRTVEEKTKEVVKKNNWQFNLTFQPPFYKETNYIEALGESIRPYLFEYDHILFSYHGVPKRHVRKTDPTNNHCLKIENCCYKTNPRAQKYCYRHHCIETTNKVVEFLRLDPERYSISFQSRLGPDKWLEPFTDEMLEAFPQKGIKSLAVVCPAFVSDCLETLEEIGMEGKKEFLDAGGEKFIQIPCLNDNQGWIDTLEHYVKQFLSITSSKAEA